MRQFRQDGLIPHCIELVFRKIWWSEFKIGARKKIVPSSSRRKTHDHNS